MVRIAFIAAALLVAGGLLYDPYTQFADTYSPFAPAPLWRLGLTALELALLLMFCILAWRKRYRRAGMLLCGETFLNLIVNTLFVSRQGIDRFLIAFGTTEILTPYLMLLALRVAMLGIIYAVLCDPVDNELHKTNTTHGLNPNEFE